MKKSVVTILSGITIILLGIVVSSASYLYVVTTKRVDNPCSIIRTDIKNDAYLYCGTCLALPCPTLEYIEYQRRGYPLYYQEAEKLGIVLEGNDYSKDNNEISGNFNIIKYFKNSIFWIFILIPILLPIFIVYESSNKNKRSSKEENEFIG